MYEARIAKTRAIPDANGETGIDGSDGDDGPGQRGFDAGEMGALVVPAGIVA